MTRLLLDTNAWLWMASDSARLGPNTRQLVQSSETELVLSAVSVWEIAIKWSIGKLLIPVDPNTFVSATVKSGGLIRMAIDFEHALRVGTLPMIHADPFDRLLIAQSMVSGLPVLTGDPTLRRYGIATVDATS
ncbi:MAG: type II toxin-antitoxin system VapC family toxin [Ilumatobacteraceae bacterium]